MITQHEGFVARWVGDGILAIGYPTAHEDAAAQAVRAGLGLVSTVRGLDSVKGRKLSARVGIATGVVVIGDIIEGGESLEEAAVAGAAVNLAARLEALAEADTGAISSSTRKLVSNQFDLAELGSHRLKGFSEPIPAWRVERERSIENRLQESGGSRGVGRLVGREQQLAQLQACWHRASEGFGQIVTIRGEPGIGKSRLVRALCDAVNTSQDSICHY